LTSAHLSGNSFAPGQVLWVEVVYCLEEVAVHAISIMAQIPKPDPGLGAALVMLHDREVFLFFARVKDAIQRVGRYASTISSVVSAATPLLSLL
jgi:hypothetical protein